MVTIWPRQSTTADTTCRIARRACGSLNESTISATSSRSRARGRPVAASPRSPTLVSCRTPGSVTSPIAWWKPGSVIARIAGVTSGPRPPGATSTIRSVRSGNW